VKAARSRHADKLAKVYDAEIEPTWSRPFGKLLLRELELPARPMVLDVGCGTGYATLEVLRRMDSDGRIIAIDASPPMLDEARTKAGPLSGKRIFFRSETVTNKLSFASEVYDLVLCNAALHEFDAPESAIGEFARVAKPGGQVIVTLPLAGTWREFFDIFREVLVKHDQQEALDRLDAYLARIPTMERVCEWFSQAGLESLETEYDSFTLLFKSGREFFFAPLIEYGPLSEWKAIAGKGEEMQKIFWEAKEAIDAYFGGSAFAVTVEAGCVRGVRGQAAGATAVNIAVPAPRAAAPEAEGLDEDDLEEVTGSAIEVVEMEREAQIEDDDEDDAL
jgi:ubiquinone/menaquinone biosynthesis C-methylase UbiE